MRHWWWLLPGLLMAAGGRLDHPSSPQAAAMAAAPLPALPDSLVQWLDRQGGQALLVQLAILDLADTTGALLYGRQAEQRQTPASLIKLCTAALAYELQGPRHRLLTRAGYDPAALVVNPHTGRRRAGALYVQPAGDPTLKRRDLVRLFQHVWQDGVDEVGELRIMPNSFDPLRLGPGWMWDDGSDPFTARPSLLTVQGNSLVAEPGPVAWDIPGSALLDLRQEPAARNVPASLERDWPAARDRFVFLSPLLPADLKPRSGRWWVRPPEPACNVEYPDSLFRSVCHEAAQEVFGTTRPPRLNWTGALPRGMAWFRHAGPPLVQVLDSMLTESWNLGAECLFQGVAAERPQPGKGGWERAALLAQEVMRDSLGVTDWLRQVDGSGLSRYNAVAPRQFVQLLAGMERRHPGQLAALLPRPGEGTLRVSPPLLPAGVDLAAKTGTLRGVSSLAGYLGTGGPPRVAFCLIITGQQSAAQALRVRNEILVRLAAWLASNPN
jgi:D-alanyl-D-alanine carboxypeptidase